jgi:hypothetical protein
MSHPTPALDLWRDELRAGHRTALTFDDLWRAACSELAALEADAAQLTRAARRHRSDAASLIRRSLKGAA